jgi:glycosyltransferase involved in cell wall biosynthesis
MARICVISKSHLPFDARVVREAQALVRAGHEVDVICGQFADQPFKELSGGITIYRLPIARRRGSKLRYAFEFVTFQLGAALLAGWLHIRRRYDVVETTSLPDWLVFAAVVPRLLGARVLLDLHDPAPEYDMTKYQLKRDHPSVRFLALLEQASIRFADFVTTCSEQMRERYAERGAPAEKIDVVLNSFDEERYQPERIAPAPRDDGAFVLITHGTIEPNYGLDVAVRAVALLKDRIPGLRLEIYGDGTHREPVRLLARELGVEREVWFSDGFRPMEEVLPRIAAADVGIVAVRRDAFRDITLCIKMFDFVSLRRPVVISRTRAVEAYFGDDCFQIFESGDAHDLARAILELYVDPDRGRRLVERATLVNEPYRWVHQGRRYVEIVERLAAGREGIRELGTSRLSQVVGER